MDLNLRKARKLESKIQNLITGLKCELQTSGSVRVNADVQTEILPLLVSTRNAFFTYLENIQGLIDARFAIRGLISDTNETSGVSAAILEKVTLENKVSIINGILNDFEVLDKETLEDDSQRHKTFLANGDRFSRSTFETNFLLASDEVELKKKQTEYSKQIEKLEDELLAFNYSVKITLSQDIVTLLQSNNLL